MSQTQRYKQFHQLVIDDFEAEKWPHPRHNHNHYELIFIAAGAGIHALNALSIPYKKGDLYLLGPEDEHEFSIQQKSRFIYFKFTGLYASHQPDIAIPANWNKEVDALLHSPLRKNGNLLHHENDRKLVQQLMEVIVAEDAHETLLHEKIIFQLFSTIMLIIKRNKQLQPVARENKEKSGFARQLVEYIALNIYTPKLITHKALGEYFNYSPYYIGALFKDTMGMSLREYIRKFRLQLIKDRLQHKATTKKEVAAEFGFTDESHLYKFLKSDG